ncbi:MAG: PIN domain-containing protein [Aquificales bacterium]|nr:PIN domain-containing protein [Aquificales bacterium]
MQIPDIFLDTSVLFSGIWSTTGGARMLLKLGEAHAAKLSVSSHVLTEIESVLRRKSPQQLGTLALLLDYSRIAVVSAASEDQIAICGSIVNYTPDAIVLAAAWTAGVDYFVTLDRKHFLDNQKLHDKAPFVVGTPGSCLAWYRNKLSLH